LQELQDTILKKEFNGFQTMQNDQNLTTRRQEISINKCKWENFETNASGPPTSYKKANKLLKKLWTSKLLQGNGKLMHCEALLKNDGDKVSLATWCECVVELK
jgi:hypothetical protein